MNVNRVIIEGRLVKDAVLKYTGSGTAICEFSIAHNRSTKKDGQWVDVPHYFNAAIYGKLAESFSKYLVKGKKVTVDGILTQNKWKDGSGNTRSDVRIAGENVSFDFPKNESAGGGNSGASVVAPPEPDHFDDDGIPF